MSVIFKTLKKLRAQSRESAEGATKSKQRRNVVSLHGMLTSAKTIFVLIGVIFLSGVAVYYGTDLLKQRIRKVSTAGNTQGSTALRMQETPTPPVADGRTVAAVPEEETMPIPPPPDVIPVEESSGANRERRTMAIRSPRSEPRVTARYHPPRKDKRQAVPIPEYGVDTAPRAPTKASVTFPLSGHGQNGPGIRDSDSPTEEVAAAPKDTHQAQTRTQCVELPQDVPAEVKKPQRIDAYRISSQKNTKIARLVTDIETSIAKGRSDTYISNLLNRLAGLKGREDPYVLKMRAFSKMRQGELGSAQSLLQHVLNTDEDDLEAGINMAIIEIKNGRYGDAKERLLSLLDMHPNNTLIADMLLQLK